MERLTLVTTAAGDLVVTELPVDVAAAIQVADETSTVFCNFTQPRMRWQARGDDDERILVRAADVIAIRPAPPTERVALSSLIGGAPPFAAG